MPIGLIEWFHVAMLYKAQESKQVVRALVAASVMSLALGNAALATPVRAAIQTVAAGGGL
jgi:hypothetical protein